MELIIHSSLLTNCFKVFGVRSIKCVDQPKLVIEKSVFGVCISGEAYFPNSVISLPHYEERFDYIESNRHSYKKVSLRNKFFNKRRSK